MAPGEPGAGLRTPAGMEMPDATEPSSSPGSFGMATDYVIFKSPASSEVVAAGHIPSDDEVRANVLWLVERLKRSERRVAELRHRVRALERRVRKARKGRRHGR